MTYTRCHCRRVVLLCVAFLLMAGSLACVRADTDAVDVAAAFECAAEGRVTELRSLLDKDAGLLAACDEAGVTLLHAAGAAGHADVVLLLLQRGADPNSRDQESHDTPLHVAASEAVQGSDTCAAARELIRHGADVSAPNRGGQTPLHLAVRAGLGPPDSPGALPFVKLLLEAGADVNARAIWGTTPLHCAVAFHAVEEIEVLLASGADPAAWDKLGQTPMRMALAERPGPSEVQARLQAAAAGNALHHAVRAGRTDQARRLVASHPEFVRQADRLGWTPFHWACFAGRHEVARMLLEAGADPSRVTPGMLTSMALAAIADSPETIRLIERHDGADWPPEHGPLWSAVHWAAHANSADALRELLALWPHPDAGSVTPLHVAVAADALEAVEVLLDAGADVSWPNASGSTPLHQAVLSDRRPEVLQALLAHGANPNARNKSGSTPVSLACCEVQADAAGQLATLLAHGGDPNTRNPNGPPVLAVAAGEGLAAAVEVLLEAGADVNPLDPDGRSPLDHAVDAGHLDVADILREHGTRSSSQLTRDANGNH